MMRTQNRSKPDHPTQVKKIQPEGTKVNEKSLENNKKHLERDSN